VDANDEDVCLRKANIPIRTVRWKSLELARRNAWLGKIDELGKL
jgi:hypothetical protein